jgi:hypothetical protein
MSTAISSAPARPTIFAPITTRFLWKEYRTLRGLWLAALIIAAFLQQLSIAFAPPGADFVTTAFGIALAATVLYAVGASAILFSAEHEDETYGFLTSLPATWPPMYVAKVATALCSSLVLAAALIGIGAVLAGGRLPAATNIQLLTGLFGFGILEAIAWGTLCSLLWKRPIAAVLCAIAVGSVAVHLAVNYAAPTGTASLNLQSYAAAIPYRLAIVMVVFACSAVVASRWLKIGNRPTSARIAAIRPTTAAAWLCRSSARPSTPMRPVSRRGTLSRLLWQAWRENWKMLVAPFAVALLLYAGIIALGGSIIGPEFAAVVGGALAFLLPTLYGALAFGADQRRDRYRFLAEHAARPRYVWLSRHFVWLGSLIGISLVVAIAASLAGVLTLKYTTGNQRFNYDFYWRYESTSASARQLHFLLDKLVVGSLLSSLGALAAYALGQICSMLLRSEILAVFLAVVLSVALSAWVAVIYLWQLNPWLCLLPLFAGFMLATWLRAPDWLTDRKSLRSWRKPALAIAAPIVILALLLPVMRRLPPMSGNSSSGTIRPNPNHYGQGDTPDARKTAAIYEKAASISTSLPEQEFMDRWYQRKYAKLDTPFGIDQVDEAKLTPNERDEYRRDLKRQEELLGQSRRQVARLIVEASRRPSCRFDIDWISTPAPISFNGREREQREEWERIHAEFLGVLSQAINFPFEELPPAEAVEFQLAALRMLDHLRQGQPTNISNMVLASESSLLQRIVQWAARKEVPTDQLMDLLEQLQTYFADNPINAQATFDADARLVRRVLEGEAPSAVLAAHSENEAIYLAFLANELPWERERALAALQRITYANMAEGSLLSRFMYATEKRHYADEYLQRWVPTESNPIEPWAEKQPDTVTSYLASLEYQTRVSVRAWFQRVLEAETYRRAALLQLALILYQREHGEYPAQLSELSPQYLQEIPTDPFTGNNQPFSYMPKGLDLPLTRYGNHYAGEIAPHTPLLWSVGPTNVRLQRMQREISLPDKDDPTDLITKVEVYYGLQADGYVWNPFGASLVFPLPSLPPARGDSDQPNP